ncbi:RimJ/RimL family protein N-acetyltransferase [Leifsonia sp. EB41]|uniref:GNAT family N-acetyltransferase n=1 Tax=Leifsonia sp. EB41 TaxID=3156260 RepID=UPI0035189D41
MTATDAILRPLVSADELELFNSIPYALNHELADDLEQGRRRLDWMWVALRGERLVGRIAWWSTAGASDLAVVRRGTELRMALLAETGAHVVAERLRLEWKPGTPIAAADSGLAFRPFASDDEFLDITTRTLTGTLDAHSRADLATMTPREAAVAQFEDEFAQYASPRAWWRVAIDEGGETVGFVVPARNSYHAIIAYIGVLPEHRGKGLIDAILAEGTRVLAESGASRIRASTDVGNVPMAAAFARAGYVTFERLINMAWE